MASLRILSLAFAAVPPLHASNPCIAVGKLFPSEQNGQERIDASREVIADKLGNKIIADRVDTLVQRFGIGMPASRIRNCKSAQAAFFAAGLRSKYAG